MTTRYQESQIEDVARILAKEGSGSTFGPVRNIARDFANLFAADNPPTCSHCDKRRGIGTVCPSPCGEHHFEGGFNRTDFLAACGLESEG
ncbi:hypothetical protein LCGC14_1069910 [marine sediment metagenome]|uniref:Uncharacterized protein n=1 Tax=marine sediment metagenome TaxID=412755 RepID=A0A0F9N5P2_9ZZZZ